jgi:hypothetical protein
LQYRVGAAAHQNSTLSQANMKWCGSSMFFCSISIRKMLTVSCFVSYDPMFKGIVWRDRGMRQNVLWDRLQKNPLCFRITM